MKNPFIVLLISLLLLHICPAKTAAQDAPTDFWGATFGTSTDEAIEAIKTKTNKTPADIINFGKATMIIYENCLWENLAYSKMQLRFYNNQLCSGMAESRDAALPYSSVTTAMRRIYGTPTANTENLCTWKFKDRTEIIVRNEPEERIISVNCHLQPGTAQYLAEANKRTAADSTRHALKAATDAPLKKELPGFWGIKFGQSPETVVNTVKATKKCTPIKRKAEGKNRSIHYANCLFGTDVCSDINLAFYNNRLCGATFTISTTSTHFLEIIKAMSSKYGMPKTLEGASWWNFEDGNGIYMTMEDDETVSIMYRDKDLELYADESRKNRTADY